MREIIPYLTRLKQIMKPIFASPAATIVLLLLTGICTPPPVSAQHELVICKITENPKKQYGRLKPILDYVTARMEDLGITGGRVKMARGLTEAEELLRAGRIDWLTETAVSSLILEDKGLADLLVRKWKDGVAEYRGIVFVRKDSGINDLNGLKGKIIAFEDRWSTSGFYLPVWLLTENGFDLAEISGPRGVPSPGPINYTFSNSELNSAFWVHRGIVSAAALSDTDWDDPDIMSELMRSEMKIIAETEPIPRALQLVRRDLDPRIKARLKEILLKMHEDPEAVRVLDEFHHTARFDPVDTRTRDRLDRVRRIIRTVQAEVD